MVIYGTYLWIVYEALARTGVGRQSSCACLLQAFNDGLAHASQFSFLLDSQNQLVSLHWSPDKHTVFPAPF